MADTTTHPPVDHTCAGGAPLDAIHGERCSNSANLALPSAPISADGSPRALIPELLSPAGDWEAMRAAVANGADAVYFGLSHFNARFRAANFTLEELPRVMKYLHAHNVRGYVTFNTLIFSDELPEAVEFLRVIAQAGVDAVIVQDLGVAWLIGRLCPSLHVHGSTQMTLTEPRGIEFVKRLGVRRVILARELSADEIGVIAAATDVPVEVFVHGALCVAYSGQCLTSESLGGRSANRGQCAQACRLPYDLIVDGRQRDLGDKAYLLSPRDLAAYDLIPDLAARGVVSFKIEGRLKSAHYVAATTQTYRAAIDAIAASRPFHLAPAARDELAQSFSRGFTHGFLSGVNHQELVHARFPKSRGLRVGTVVGKTDQGVLIEPSGGNGAQLKAGDGVVFDEGHPEQDEQGGRIFAVKEVPAKPSARRPSRVFEICFGRGAVNPSAVAAGSTVWKTDDPAVRRKLEQSYNRDQIVRPTPLHVALGAREGQLLQIAVTDDAGHCVTVTWDRPLERAEKFPLTLEMFKEQFGRLGGTPFTLGAVDVANGPLPRVMVPKSVLNDLRRQVVAQLIEMRTASARHAIAQPDALESIRREIAEARAADSSEAHPSPAISPAYSDVASIILPAACGVVAAPERSPLQGASSSSPPTGPVSADNPALYALVRSEEQLDAIVDWPASSELPRPPMVYCEFEDVRRYPAAVERARAARMPIALATLRIVKPHETGLLKQIAAAAPDAVLVRNLAGLSYFREQFPRLPLLGDYALNIANEITAHILVGQGIGRMVPSYDLNWRQLAAMVGRFGPGRFEAVIHQHMPMFHMEHCVFSHTLSNGKDFHDCGRPCDRHKVDLRDRASAAHPLVADVGCRNTVYNGTAQSAAEFVPEMRRLGIAHYRIELLRESGAQAVALIGRYLRVLRGLDDPHTTWRQLRVLNQLGVTRGTLAE